MGIRSRGFSAAVEVRVAKAESLLTLQSRPDNLDQ